MYKRRVYGDAPAVVGDEFGESFGGGVADGELRQAGRLGLRFDEVAVEPLELVTVGAGGRALSLIHI